MSIPVQSVSQVKQTLTHHLKNRSEIYFALLYGSAIEDGSFRDLDIGLFVDRGLVPDSTELDYAFNLADELERAVSYPVDVRIINNAPLGFRYNVSRGEALAINDETAFFHFLERTWDEFFDFEPVAMQYLRELR